MDARTSSPWPWPRSLATAGAGEHLRIAQVLFGTIERKCEKAGIRAGDLVTCTSADGSNVHLELENGDEVDLDLSTAWFVEVHQASHGRVPRPDPGVGPGVISRAFR